MLILQSKCKRGASSSGPVVGGLRCQYKGLLSSCCGLHKVVKGTGTTVSQRYAWRNGSILDAAMQASTTKENFWAPGVVCEYAAWHVLCLRLLSRLQDFLATSIV